MTKRDFFRVIIKLFGLYQLLLVIFQGIPTFLNVAHFDSSIPTILYATIIFGIAIGTFILLIFKVDSVINWLRLDTGFDEEYIQFGNFNPIQIIKLAIIFISGTMILNNIPTFIYQSYEAFRVNVDRGMDSMFDVISGSQVNYLSWVVAGLNIIIGYLLLTNYKSVASWFDNKTTIEKQ